MGLYDKKLCEINFRKWTIAKFLQEKLSQNRTKLVEFPKISPIKVFFETKF